jgi:hypothetical protein
MLAGTWTTDIEQLSVPHSTTLLTLFYLKKKGDSSFDRQRFLWFKFKKKLIKSRG